MPMPSEPGPYWWRRGADSPWQFAHVDEDVRQFCVWEEYTGHAGEWSIYPVHGMEWGEWGGRIPDNETLEALRELAADIDTLLCELQQDGAARWPHQERAMDDIRQRLRPWLKPHEECPDADAD